MLANAHGVGRRSRTRRWRRSGRPRSTGLTGATPARCAPLGAGDVGWPPCRRSATASVGAAPRRRPAARRRRARRRHGDGRRQRAGARPTATTRAGRRPAWPRTCGCSAPTAPRRVIVAAAAAGRPRARRCRPAPPTPCSGSGGPPSGPRRSPRRRASIASRRQTDPSLATFDGGRWARRMAHVLRVVRGAPLDAEPPARPADRRARRRAGRGDARRRRAARRRCSPRRRRSGSTCR